MRLVAAVLAVLAGTTLATHHGGIVAAILAVSTDGGGVATVLAVAVAATGSTHGSVVRTSSVHNFLVSIFVC